jgi:hypothetical protein
VFCNGFDEELARTGPPAIFLPDREGLLRFDAEWTRDRWDRAQGPHERVPMWVLFRDSDTGFVLLLFTTAASLVEDHVRGDVRQFADRSDAVEMRDRFGSPPVCVDAW